ncbi:hypothetical protein M758_UG181100 [Ceratodon purpureus]|nr:hypothetical protein M758_UG181100 [Ceratodon purpureus]
MFEIHTSFILLTFHLSICLEEYVMLLYTPCLHGCRLCRILLISPIYTRPL